MAQDECHLLRLSTELILQILEYGPTSAYLDVALTCTTLHHQCRNLLDPHHEAHAKYRITSDLSSETVIGLLKDTTKTRIERWHVRELEIWGSRQDWEDWRPWVPKLPGTCGLADGFPRRYGLDLQDTQRYIRTALELWTFSDFDSEAIQWDLKAGQDRSLKLLLIATCPRLHSLRFVKRGLDPHTTLQSMREVIKDSRRTKGGPHELQGFESLRDIAVGIETDQRSWNDISPLRDARDFAALFYIPNLESLYFNDLHYIEDGNEDYQHSDVVDQYGFPRGTSSVKHLFIDSASEFSPEYYQGIADVSKKLESVVLRVASEQRQDLDDVDVNYRLDDLDDFGNLKLFTLAVSDIELEELHLMHSSPNAEQLAEYVSDSFPASTEAIYVWGRSDGHADDSKSDDIPSDILDSTLASLIESGVLENLKVVYLADVEKRHAQDNREIALGRPIDVGLKDTGPKQLMLQKSVAAGLKTGVHVCTLMNRDDGGYWKNFPGKPDRFELKTGPCYGERPASWRLNLQSGEWGPDCEGCGECKDCLVVYPAELWKSSRP
ncbi:hypothetical protein ACKRZS_002493 [Fusarium odoratissimum]